MHIKAREIDGTTVKSYFLYLLYFTGFRNQVLNHVFNSQKIKNPY